MSSLVTVDRTGNFSSRIPLLAPKMPGLIPGIATLSSVNCSLRLFLTSKLAHFVANVQIHWLKVLRWKREGRFFPCLLWYLKKKIEKMCRWTPFSPTRPFWSIQYKQTRKIYQLCGVGRQNWPFYKKSFYLVQLNCIIKVVYFDDNIVRICRTVFKNMLVSNYDTLFLESCFPASFI